MHLPINYISRKEFSIKAEDLFLRLFIDAPIKDNNRNSSDLYHILHDHATSELFICSDGEISIRFKNGTVMLSAGEAAIVPKGMLHTKCPDRESSVWHAISFICG